MIILPSDPQESSLDETIRTIYYLLRSCLFQNASPTAGSTTYAGGVARISSGESRNEDHYDNGGNYRSLLFGCVFEGIC